MKAELYTMNNSYRPVIDYIKEQQENMISLLEKWANINSGSDNVQGLSQMLQALKDEFSTLGGELEQIPLPPRQKISSKGEVISFPSGEALHLVKHSDAPFRVFLGGHMDTVYPATSPFQKAVRIDKNTMRGPGVTDMKGGLVILLTALQAFEKSPFAGKIGWEVLINPDEEIGSPGSDYLFVQSAKRNDIGLIFEPSYPDGTLVSSRKGSANFALVARGRGAHAGRDFFEGRNAITAMARFITKAETLIHKEKGITLNVGYIEGGGPVNIVPDLAFCRINIRVSNSDDMDKVKSDLNQIVKETNGCEEVSFVMHEETSTPPKPFDSKIEALFSALKKCGQWLGMQLACKPSGGACDGCRLYAAGLPNLDTLGAIGGNIHTHDEYIHLPSLTERARLTALFLMMLAAHEIDPLGTFIQGNNYEQRHP